MPNTLILSVCSLINNQLHQISPTFHNHFPISVTLPFITPASRYQEGKKKMDNKSDYQFVIMKAAIDGNRKASDEKMNKYESKFDRHESKLDKLISLIENMMQ